ncbi:MAG: glycosyltransferase [bacterium]|nr:glycosyltransferase [bacterium]
MKIGILIPGFSASEDDWAIPVQQTLVRELSQTDDVRVIALRYPHHRNPYRIYGATVYPLGAGAWARGKARLRLWRDTLLLLRRLHKQQAFDVLHAMWADETGLLAVWAGRWLGIPVVVSIAGGELVGFEDIDYGLQRSRFSRWTVGQALRGAQVIVGASSYSIGRIAAAGYRISSEKIYLIPLGIDTDFFTPASSAPISNHLIHAASLVGVKDQATLLRAIHRLQDVTVDIIGEGPLRPPLEALSSQLGIESRVQFLGAVHHLDMPNHYQQAALHILTSRHEGQGMVTLEAAACAVPTISTAVGLVPDVPEIGLTVPVGDDAALAAAIRSLLNDAARRAQLAESALHATRTRFTIQQTAAALRTLYGGLSV